MAVGDDTVRIISDHAKAVAVCPAFPGYPTAVVGEGDAQRILPFPAAWEEVATWAATPPAVADAPNRFTEAGFMRLFTQEEFDALLAVETTDADVRRMWAFIRAVGYADMHDSLTVNSLAILRAKNFIPTDERLQEIKAGVAKM
ncbi:hypothetical protein K9F62_19735 [Desulfovibrio sp. JY]|nr:hypothetical protein K9F62_19735 [Desulfovibrio sp. JY]